MRDRLDDKYAEIEDLQDELDVMRRQVKELLTQVNNSNMTSSYPAQKMLFEVLGYRYESAKEKDVPHVITFEEANYNVGHAMNVVTGNFTI